MPAHGPSRRATPIAVAASGAALAVLGLAALAPAMGAASTFDNCNDKIKMDGKQGKASFPKGGEATTRFTNVTITGCDMEIKAKTLSTTSLDVNDSNWQLDGDVHIRAIAQQTRIDADHAVVQFRNSEIHQITINGNPAEFEQKRANTGVVTHGRARKMIYQANLGIVSLIEDAWVSDGSKEIKTPRLDYDIRKAEIRNTGSSENNANGTGKSNEGERVIITIDPKASKATKKDDDKKPVTSPAPAKP
jgi:lipopolysaccharide transport protein LptA